MKLSIEEFISASGWTSSDASKISVQGLNEHQDFIAGGNAASLMFKFVADSSGEYIEKTVSKDVTDYDYLVLSVHSVRQPNNGTQFDLKANFLYQFDVNSGMTDYMIPVYSSMTQAVFDISAINTITRVRITSNTNLADYLVCSHMVAVKDQIPADIFIALKESIDTLITDKLDQKYLVGTVTATAGDVEIKIAGTRNYLDKYAVVEIDDGANSEIHQLMSNDELTYKLGGMYEGNTLTNSFAAANVYLYFPCEYGVLQKEILLPGIAISGMAPTPIKRGGKIERVLDSYDASSGVRERFDDQINEYNITIDCEARHDDLIAEMSELVRTVIARKLIWCNGQPLDIDFLNPPQYIAPVEGYNEIPKIQYTAKVEIKEKIWDRETLPVTSTVTGTVTIAEQGGI